VPSLHRTVTQVHDGWTLRGVGGPLPENVVGQVIPATVPGSTHPDLLAAGLIPDPYLDLNEDALVWAHRASWRYETAVATVPPADDERVDLVFHGLDTVATVRMDGALLGLTKNMHRSYRFDLRAVLARPGIDADGAHHLTVDFRSALEYAEEVEDELGERAHTNQHPFNMVRKMACSFGWDWGPDLQTAGIWKPVELQRWRVARLATVRPLVTTDGTAGRLEAHVAIERSGLGLDDGAPLTVTASVAGVRAEVSVGPRETSAVVVVEVPEVDLWWPLGHGEQPLYDLTVSLATGDAALDTYQRRIGFRTVELDTSPDEIGTSFTFRVNGRPIFVKGANWIPDDHLLTRVTRAQYERSIGKATSAGMNLLRVWGGGIYETEDFYEVCDAAGVMVWQDFLFACAAYPEEDPIRSEVEAEARENVVRLMPHPSLVLWNGNNENIWGYVIWGWAEKLDGATWGLSYYRKILPDIVRSLDPTRPYAEGSPISPGYTQGEKDPNDPDHGSMHIWDVWNKVDYSVYRDYIPRFCSEFGFQGPATWSTLTRAVRDEPLTSTSPAFLAHQKAPGGNGKLARGYAPHLPEPTTFEDWHWTTQLNQARAVKFGIEHMRSHWPRCAGTVVWQLNDCWPVTSWAAVDGDDRRKPLWYALRQAYAPRVLTIQPRGEVQALVIGNDTDRQWTGTVSLRRIDLDGTELASAELALAVPPRVAATLEIPAAIQTPGLVNRELIVAQADDVRALHFFAEDKDVAYDAAPYTATVERIDGGYRVHVAANGVVRDLTLLPERIAPDAEVDETLVSLLPGERGVFTVRTTAELDAAELTSPLVLRSVNQLVG